MIALACQITDQGWMVAFTLIIAATTIVYAFFTALLWRQTKKSADATALLAQSAKDTAEAAIELNRPMLGIDEVKWLPIPNVTPIVVPGARHIVVNLKNFGSLYARRVVIEWKSYIQGPNETRNSGFPPTSDLPKDASLPVDLAVGVKPEDAARMREGREHYKISIQADYSTPDEKRRWRYKAVRAFHAASNTFTMDDQVPDTTERLTSGTIPKTLPN